MNRKAFSLPAVIICVLLILASVAAIFVMQNFGSDAKDVAIYKDGKVITTLPLSENTEYEISDVGMTIKIENDAAFIEKSNCRCKTCQNFGKLSKAGQTAVCLPSKVHIEVLGESGLDATL